MKTTLILLLLVSSIGYSDDLFLKSGIVIRNIKVGDSTDTHLNFVRDGKSTTILLQLIEKIDLKEIDPNHSSKYERFRPENVSEKTESKSKYELSKAMQNTMVEYPNLKLLPVSVVCFGLAWDYLSSASDISNTIEAYNKLKQDTGQLQSQKNRKQILGVVFITAGIINTAISFQSVEVRVQSNSLSLNVRF